MVGGGLPFYDDIVVNLLTQIDLLLRNFVYNGYSALSSYLTTPLGIIASIAVAFFGISIMMGWVQMKMSEFSKMVIKIALIFAAVTQWSFVSEHFIGLINSAIGGLGDALISASPVHIPGVDGMDGALQLVLIQFTKLGAELFNTGGFSNIGGWFDGTLVWGFGYVMIAIGLFEIILAKVMLAVLFVFTPLITIFCYFKPFQPIFDRWLGAIIGFALLQLFVTATLGLALSIVYWWLGAHIAESALHIGNYGTLPIIIIGGVCIGLIVKAASLAQNLGGIVTSSSGAAMIGGMVGGFVGAGASSMKGAGSVLKHGARGAMGLLSQIGGSAGEGGTSGDTSLGSSESAASQAQTRADLRGGE